jgi:glycogen debranching enzyme
LNPSLARGTLRALAARQGIVECADNDEQPGKILHELRSGEMSATGEVAFGKNYGSIDATPLFIILLDEYFQWTGDRELLEEMRSPLSLALNWLIEYGDMDGDGLIEYCRKTEKGLFNQGWKDSGDAMAHADGTLAERLLKSKGMRPMLFGAQPR